MPQPKTTEPLVPDDWAWAMTRRGEVWTRDPQYPARWTRGEYVAGVSGLVALGPLLGPTGVVTRRG